MSRRIRDNFTRGLQLPVKATKFGRSFHVTTNQNPTRFLKSFNSNLVKLGKTGWTVSSAASSSTSSSCIVQRASCIVHRTRAGTRQQIARDRGREGVEGRGRMARSETHPAGASRRYGGRYKPATKSSVCDTLIIGRIYGVYTVAPGTCVYIDEGGRLVYGCTVYIRITHSCRASRRTAM